MEPAVLRWARETIGLEVERAAKRAGCKPDKLRAWEDGRELPTWRSLERLADAYRRPLSALLLPEPPADPPMPSDFRALPDTHEYYLPEELRRAVRRARRLRRTLTDLLAELGRATATRLRPYGIDSDPEGVADVERGKLGVSLEVQAKWPDERAALWAWRGAVEETGLLVLQSSFPMQAARGFSIVVEGTGAIVLNSRDHPHGRIFTLFHEYAHLLLNESGICLPSEVGTRREARQPIEAFCNHFAGAVLVPGGALEADKEARAIAEGAVDTTVALRALSRRFRVSKYVIWRRLHQLGFVGKRKYWAQVRVWEQQVPEPTVGRSGGPPPAVRCVADNGHTLTATVLEAAERDLITYRDATDYLSLRPKHLDEVEDLV